MLLAVLPQTAKKVAAEEGLSPQRLKPHSKQCGYRSAEALRHPKSRRPDSRSKPSFSAVCLATVVIIGLLAALIGCYSGGNPTRIGSNAPDFTVQDSDRKVTLSQFRGQVVVLNFWGT